MSASKQRQSDGAGKDKNTAQDRTGDKKVRKGRTADVGRALRTVYDDTLRESVPDDFLDLLGKLT